MAARRWTSGFTLRTPVHSRCHGMRVSVTGATSVRRKCHSTKWSVPRTMRITSIRASFRFRKPTRWNSNRPPVSDARGRRRPLLPIRPAAFTIARRGRGIAERPRRARKKGKEMIVEKGFPRRLIKETLANIAALVALTLMSGTVTADQTTTTAQLAIDQFDECAESLFKDDFDPAEVDYELSLNKEAVLFLSAKWRSHDGTINILTRIRSIGSTVIREMTMTQNGASNDELPPPAAKVKEHIAKVFEECPPEKEDIDCADAVTERFNGIEQVVRNNLEYPDVTVEKYTSNEQVFRASKEVQRGSIDDYSLVLNGAT